MPVAAPVLIIVSGIERIEFLSSYERMCCDDTYLLKVDVMVQLILLCYEFEVERQSPA